MAVKIRGYQLFFFVFKRFNITSWPYSSPNSFFLPAGGAVTASLR